MDLYFIFMGVLEIEGVSVSTYTQLPAVTSTIVYKSMVFGGVVDLMKSHSFVA